MYIPERMMYYVTYCYTGPVYECIAGDMFHEHADTVARGVVIIKEIIDLTKI